MSQQHRVESQCDTFIIPKMKNYIVLSTDQTRSLQNQPVLEHIISLSHGIHITLTFTSLLLYNFLKNYF